MPSKEDIEAIGMAPVRSQIKGKNVLQNQIDRLQARIDTREAMGKGHELATKKLEKAKIKQKAIPTGPTYRP